MVDLKVSNDKGDARKAGKDGESRPFFLFRTLILSAARLAYYGLYQIVQRAEAFGLVKDLAFRTIDLSRSAVRKAAKC